MFLEAASLAQNLQRSAGNVTVLIDDSTALGGAGMRQGCTTNRISCLNMMNVETTKGNRAVRVSVAEIAKQWDD